MSVQEKERALFAVRDRIAAQGDVPVEALGHSDRVFVAIWMLEAELNNGGFSQWMFNSDGDHAEFSVAALHREVGAEQAARVCERFFCYLPGGRPLPEQNARQGQLDAAIAALGAGSFEDACLVLEKEFYALEDDLRDRLLAFSEAAERAHRDVDLAALES